MEATIATPAQTREEFIREMQEGLAKCNRMLRKLERTYKRETNGNRQARSKTNFTIQPKAGR